MNMTTGTILIIAVALFLLAIVIIWSMYTTHPQLAPHNCPNCGNSFLHQTPIPLTFSDPIKLKNGKMMKQTVDICSQCLYSDKPFNEQNMNNNLRLLLYEEKDIPLIIEVVKRYKDENNKKIR